MPSTALRLVILKNVWQREDLEIREGSITRVERAVVDALCAAQRGRNLACAKRYVLCETHCTLCE